MTFNNSWNSCADVDEVFPIKKRILTLKKLLVDFHSKECKFIPVEFKRFENLPINGIAYDYKRVKKNFLYVAVSTYMEINHKEVSDGHMFIKQAISNGAFVIILDKKFKITNSDFPKYVLFIRVNDTREALSIISRRFYNYENNNIKIIGITGTNGKTSTALLALSVLLASGKKAGIICSTKYVFGNHKMHARETTPEAPDLLHMITYAKERGFKYLVLEVSSHSIAFHRILGLKFHSAALTSISSDHLDFHKSIKAYTKVKSLLFKRLAKSKFAILNNDDQHIENFLKESKCSRILYGINNKSDIFASGIQFNNECMRLTLNFKHEKILINSRLIGVYNAYNILAAAGIGISEGIKLKTVKKGIENLKSVPGRMSFVKNNISINIIIDYAHNHESMRKTLELAKSITKKRIITVFGSAGGRDKTKRPLMGKISERFSFHTFVTADDVRDEDPFDIAKEIISGFNKNNYTIKIDRKEAIQQSIKMANPGDTILILGMGIDKMHEINGVMQEFSDFEIIRQILNEKNEKSKAK